MRATVLYRISVTLSLFLLILAVATCSDDEGTTDTVATDTASDTTADTSSDTVAPSTATLSAIYTDSSGDALEGVMACGIPDNDAAQVCATSDTTGMVSLVLPDDTTYVVEITKTGYISALTTYDPASGDIEVPFSLVSDFELLGAAALVGVTLDDSKGHIVAFAYNQTPPVFTAVNRNWGGTFDLTPASGEGAFYFDANGRPDADLTETSRNGTAAYLNVDPGDYTMGMTNDDFTCSPQPANVSAGGRNSIPVKAGFFSVPLFGCSHASDLACDGNVPATVPSTEATVNFIGRLYDGLSSAPVVGATIKVCERSDATCANPLSTETTNDNGIAETDVPTGSDIYFDVSATGYPNTLIYPGQPLWNDSVFIASGQMFNDDALALLAGVLEITIDPTRGQLLVGTNDCDTLSTGGISIDVDTKDENSTLFYFDGPVPSTTLTASTSAGVAGVANMPVGTATVTATVAGSSTSHFTDEVMIRAGTITGVFSQFYTPPVLE